MIHEVGDGLGLREVFVDGHKQDKVVWVDTDRGVIVRAHDELRFIYDRSRDIHRLELFPVWGKVSVYYPAEVSNDDKI